ncbi:MAG: hypothetical protein ACHREM_15865, partial [Polyangiales bacterium]
MSESDGEGEGGGERDQAPASKLAPPSSAAAPGVEMVSSRRDRPLSLGAPPPPPTEIASDKPTLTPSQRRRLGVAIATAALGAVGVAALFAWRHGRYERGAIVAYLPDDCRSVSLVDYAAIEATPIARATIDRIDRAIEEWVDDADSEDGVRHT